MRIIHICRVNVYNSHVPNTRIRVYKHADTYVYLYIRTHTHIQTHKQSHTHTLSLSLSLSLTHIYVCPWAEWRGLKIGGWKLNTQKGCILYLQIYSIWVGISGDKLSSRIFWRNYKFQDKMTWIKLRKTHALLRLAHAVHSLLSICGKYES